jgi:surfactin synthase thioesterase subunit
MWLRALKRAADARMTLVCLPHAGGGASAYYRFAQQFGGAVEVIGVQYPGRGERLAEEPIVDLEALAGEIAAEIAGGVQRRFALVGLSFGALVGFVVARALRRSGAPGPAFLALGGRSAPQLPSPASGLHVLPPARFVDALIELYGDPDGMLREPEIAEMVVPPLRADVRAAAEWVYRAEPPLAAPLLAFAGREDRELTPERLAAWREHTSGWFEQLVLPGGHFVFSDGAPELAQVIQRRFAALL